MQAGPDLDAEVARKVFRHVVMYDEAGRAQVRDLKLGKFVDVPPYSTDTDAAYKILNHFQHLGFRSQVGSTMQDNYLVWSAKITKVTDPDWGVMTQAGTLSHAVSLAGLALIPRLNES